MFSAKGNRPNGTKIQLAVSRIKHKTPDSQAQGPMLVNPGGSGLTTLDSVRDMESIRMALGAPQINYYGFSYGTYLGQVYGTLCPNRFRRVIFDGVVNATRVWYDANLDQDFAFNKSVKVFFAYVAAHNSTWHLGTTEAQVELRYYAELKKLIGHPADGKIGPSEWNDIFTQAAYYVYGWVFVANAFAAWVHDGAVPDLEQRLVQRTVRVLAGDGRSPGEGRREPGPESLDDQRDPRRRNAVLGRTADPQDVPERGAQAVKSMGAMSVRSSTPRVAGRTR